jgi:hypothetical protein
MMIFMTWTNEGNTESICIAGEEFEEMIEEDLASVVLDCEWPKEGDAVAVNAPIVDV